MAQCKVDKDKCKGCQLCVVFCPKKILILSDSLNKKGMRYVFLTDKEACSGCGMCYLVCREVCIEVEG